MFDKDITIINKYFNKDTKMNEYRTHCLKGFWSSNTGITISNTSIVKNDGLKAMILFTEVGYVKPKEYRGIEGTWTLQNDDYLVKGIVEKVESLTTVKENYECMKITDIQVKDYGSDEMQHFTILGE